MVGRIRVALTCMVAILGITGCTNQSHLQDGALPSLPALPDQTTAKPLRIQSAQRPAAMTKFYLHTGSAQSTTAQRNRTNVTKQSSRDTMVRSLTARNKPVKGIYVSSWVAGSKHRLDRLVQLVDNTDLNAMVIDVKNDYGLMTYRSTLPAVKAIGADRHVAIADINSLLRRLKAKNIYVIGRIVTFKDPLYAKAHPSMALQKRGGGVWRDAQGKAWLDPFQPDVRAYNQAIAEEAASIGFDEVQFDYVRFPDNGGKVNREVRYHDASGQSKSEVISAFLRNARRHIHKHGALVSADVFGLVTSSSGDMGIGQSWRAVSGAVDAISPMTYPSHYSTGMYGIKQPDLSPYAVVHHALVDAKRRNALMRSGGQGTTATIRPWLQSFTARWVHPHQTYGAEQVNKQVQAARDLGIRDFLLWSPNCRYDYRP